MKKTFLSSARCRQILLAWAAAASIFTLAPATVSAAADYPRQQITIVVPFPPGGPFDIIARALSTPLAAKLGQPVVVENRPGASGMIGATRVARAAPDGYTLLLGSSGTQALNPNVFSGVQYKSPDDFAPLAELARAPSILMVGKASPFKTVGDFIDYMSKNPGEINLGNAGAGSVSNQAAMTFLASVGGKVTAVSYKGTAPALVDLIGGQIDALFDTAVQALPHIKGDRVRALAVTSADRIASLPNVPTLNETCCKGAELLIWYGLLAPAKTPKDVIGILTRAVLEARSDPQFQAVMRAGEAIVPSPSEGAAEFAAKINRDVVLFEELARKAGVVKQ